jgi:WD40 repeat protein
VQFLDNNDQAIRVVRLIARSWGDHFTILDITNKHPLCTLQEPSGFVGMTLSPNNDQLITMDIDSELRYWDLENLNHNIRPHISKSVNLPADDVTYRMRSSHDRTKIATVNRNLVFSLWDATTAKKICDYQDDQDPRISLLSFLDEHTVIIKTVNNPHCKLWNTENNQISSFKLPENCHHIGTIEGKIIAGHFDGTLDVCDPKTSTVNRLVPSAQATHNVIRRTLLCLCTWEQDLVVLM